MSACLRRPCWGPRMARGCRAVSWRDGGDRGLGHSRGAPCPLAPSAGWRARGSGELTVSVAESAAGRSGRGRPGWRGGRGDRGKAGGGDEEVLDALAGHLAGGITGEGVQRVAVVGDLVAVDVVEHAEL